MKLNEEDFKKHNRIIKTQNIIRYSKVFLFFGVLILSMISVYNLDLREDELSIMLESEDYFDGPYCDNLTFQETAICLNEFARKNFHYNITDDSLTLTIQEMMERGGDCRDWTNFYKTNMAQYGFNNSQIVRMFVEEEEDVSIYHVYLNIGHSTGYCNMDIKDLECYRFVNDEGEEKE